MSPAPAQLPPAFASALAAAVATWPFVEEVWLFGSRARGDARPRSDIDLAIAAPQATPSQWAEVLEWFEERAPTLLMVDVVRLERASQALRSQIARDGVAVYRSPRNPGNSKAEPAVRSEVRP